MSPFRHLSNLTKPTFQCANIKCVNPEGVEAIAFFQLLQICCILCALIEFVNIYCKFVPTCLFFQVVRIQSPEHGTKRIQSSGSEKISNFLNKVQNEFQVGDIGWTVYKDRQKNFPIRTSRVKTLANYDIHHGDMLFLSFESDASSRQTQDSVVASTSTAIPVDSKKYSANSTVSNSSTVPHLPHKSIVLDEVDEILEKEDGKVERQRNEQLCHHGPQGKCLHCAALEPYDEEVMKSCKPPTKFFSFHSYLRKLTGGVDKGKFANLEDITCKIKDGCTEHPPWPHGICTKCQPNAVTLNRQIYRHVDNIMFENPKIAERFLNYWRSTGRQRLGILYGKYEVHKDVPLGIKATIFAIYEPPQESSKNRIQIMKDENDELVKSIAEKMGLHPIGWIFTDLMAEDLKKATVKHYRGNQDSHYLSAEECIMAAEFQNKYPNPCQYSAEGKFGSKCVTVVVTGDSKNQVHFEGYQVSNQCMALVRDNCLIPTKDAPELGYVKESSSKQFVPDVFYKVKDEYGNEVIELARPLPVEYLLVDIPCAFPVCPRSFFNVSASKPFPVENRESLGEIQDFNALVQYMEQFQPNDFLEAMSDFHLLLFLATCDMLPLKETISIILEAVKTKDKNLAHKFKKSEEWATVEEMMAAQ
ncbi:nuclear protein localization protein 4 homolog, partial [Octopus sinensis]|uniref:Nuclear protein localization protein 4 homolog n=1 Tax=Octopus sinensis TaxID=2607531 RepID=A0A6P7TXA7_9MOLL